MTDMFRVALTGDFYDGDGKPRYRDIGLDLFESDPKIQVTSFSRHLPEVSPEQLAGFHGVIVLSPKVTARSLEASSELLAVGRFGVGFDSVDVAACTAANVLLFITAGAVDHSVAEGTVSWMLALSHHLRVKDALVRSGKWHERSFFMGSELRDRTLGIVGLGGIGRSVIRMLKGFRMRSPLVYDPFVPSTVLAETGARSVSLDELMAESDFVSLHCPLNEHTRNMITARELARMKPTAYLINTARGGIVNEDDLYEVLCERRIAGAALDCFADEPLIKPPRWAKLDNVLLAPHAIAWTNELFRDIGRAACQGIIELAQGRTPHGIINPEVIDRPAFQAKLTRWQ